MKLSDLKAKIDRLYKEYGDLDCVYPSCNPSDFKSYQPGDADENCFFLGWVDDNKERLTLQPVNPGSDQAVLVIASQGFVCELLDLNSVFD